MQLNVRLRAALLTAAVSSARELTMESAALTAALSILLEAEASSSPHYGGGVACAACGRPVFDAERRTAAGQSYHQNCFRCSEC